ncbi:MAG TPA: hypothetical protein VD972_29540 [Hyalangium sp.]|nr:hypothetical protein [Hyalangium sp.]HYI00134.1 hypothetical protein [Hyalangium sp.]
MIDRVLFLLEPLVLLAERPLFLQGVVGFGEDRVVAVGVLEHVDLMVGPPPFLKALRLHDEKLRMKSPNRALALWLPVILTGLMGGCSRGARVTTTRALAPLAVTDPNLNPTTDPNPPASVAQAAGTCWNSMSCCIQNHPFTFVESCGADPFEAAKILEALGQLEAVARALEATGRLPKWKKECIDNYVVCQQRKWVGNCYDCLRRCEGQHKWPEDMCYDPREQN